MTMPRKDTKRKTKNLTIKELDELHANKLTIRVSWISPEEGYEYKAVPMGGRNWIAIRKSPRAAYNAAMKWVKENKAKKE